MLKGGAALAVKKKFPRILLKVISAVLTFILLAVICVLLILANPQSDKKDPAEPQPLLTATSAVSIQAETEMRKLVESFPVPVMSFMSGSGMVFVSGTSSDAAYNGGFGRIATLYWQTPDGDPLILQSIYPASAFTLLGSGYQFSNAGGPTLFSSPSVRMETADTIRIHAATDTGLYVMVVPRSLASQISALSRSLQLVTVSQ